MRRLPQRSPNEPLTARIVNERNADIFLREYGGCNDTPSLLRGERQGQVVELVFPAKCGETCWGLQQLDSPATCTTDCASPRISRLAPGEARQRFLGSEFVRARMPGVCTSYSEDDVIGCYTIRPLDRRGLELTARALYACDPNIMEDCDSPTPRLISPFEDIPETVEVTAIVEEGTDEVILRFR